MEILEFIKSIEKNDFSDHSGECKMTRGEPTTDQDIDTVEKGIGTKLPIDYKEFVKKYGDADFFGV